MLRIAVFLFLVSLAFIIQSCHQATSSPPDGNYAIGESTYTIQQIIDGEAPEISEIGPIRELKSLAQIGLDMNMITPDAILLSWGTPGYTSTDMKSNSELSGIFEYFLEGKPTSSNPIDLVEAPHIMATYFRGSLSNISAKAGETSQDAARYKLGKLSLLGNSMEQYKSVLGKPTYLPAVKPGRQAVISRWDYIAGEKPNRILVLIEVRFENDKAKRASIDFGYEVSSNNGPGE